MVPISSGLIPVPGSGVGVPLGLMQGQQPLVQAGAVPMSVMQSHPQVQPGVGVYPTQQVYYQLQQQPHPRHSSPTPKLSSSSSSKQLSIPPGNQHRLQEQVLIITDAALRCTLLWIIVTCTHTHTYLCGCDHMYCSCRYNNDHLLS